MKKVIKKLFKEQKFLLTYKTDPKYETFLIE